MLTLPADGATPLRETEPVVGLPVVPVVDRTSVAVVAFAALTVMLAGLPVTVPPLPLASVRVFAPVVVYANTGAKLAPLAKVPVLGVAVMPALGVNVQTAEPGPLFVTVAVPLVPTTPVALTADRVMLGVAVALTTMPCGLPVIVAPTHVSTLLYEAATVATTLRLTVAPAAIAPPLLGVMV